MNQPAPRRFLLHFTSSHTSTLKNNKMKKRPALAHRVYPQNTRQQWPEGGKPRGGILCPLTARWLVPSSLSPMQLEVTLPSPTLTHCHTPLF